MTSISDSLNRSVLPLLKALVPHVSYQHVMSANAKSHPDQQIYTIVQVFLLAYTAANNLVKIDTKVNLRMFSEYLGELFRALLCNILIRPVQDVRFEASAWMAVAQTMFHAAIERGDCDIAERLLTNPQFSIDINSRTGPFEDTYMTPLSRSVQLENLEMVILLLRLRSDVNKSYCTYNSRASLDYMVAGSWCSQDHLYSKKIEIVELLLNAGAVLHSWTSKTTIISTINHSNIELWRLLVKFDACGANELIFSDNVLRSILKTLEERDILWFLDAARSTGNWSIPVESADETRAITPEISAATWKVTYCPRGLSDLAESKLTADFPEMASQRIWARRLIDVAIQRHHSAVMRCLLSLGMAFSSDALVVAIHDKNFDLCKLILSHGVDPNDSSEHYRTTPLAEALRTGQDEIIALLSPSDFLSGIHDRQSCCAALLAIADAGDCARFQSLLQCAPSNLLKANCFLAALSIAVEKNDITIATMILEKAQGSDCQPRPLDDRDHCLQHTLHSSSILQPLKIAVEKRNLVSFELLLEHGFGWDIDEDEDGMASMYEPLHRAMDFAVEWGEFAVIEELYNRGSHVGHSLRSVIRNGNLDYAQLLMDLSTTLDTSHDATVVQEAVRQGDAQMLRKLLRHGFNPRNSHAFTLAIAQSPSLVQVLMDAVIAGLPPAEIRPSDFAFATATLASVIAWGEALHVRNLLMLGIPTDTCRLRLAPLIPHLPVTDLTSTKYICCFRNTSGSFGRDFLLHESYFFPWISAIENDTGDHIMNGIYSPLAVAILKDDDPCLSVLSEVLEISARRGVNLDKAVLFSACESRVLGNISRSKYTALLCAIITRNMDKIRLLLEFGAGINTAARHGVKRTPLQKAAEIGSWAIVELLLSRGADVNGAPSVRGGATALQLAAIGGYVGIAEFLVIHGADVLAPGAKVHGRTALEGAAEHGRYDMIQFLTQHSVHPNGQFESAIGYATSNGHHAVAELLKDLRDER